jgi:hypothetical protein
VRVAAMATDIGKRGDDVWQWQGRLIWETFTEADSRKMQQAYLLGKPRMDIWDRSALRELDFANMRALPGRQALRYEQPPPPLPAAKKMESIIPAELPSNVDEWHDDEGFLLQQQGLKCLVHPMFMDMEPPRFSFRPTPPELAHKEFVWARELELCEDSADFICTLSKIYMDELENERPELPVYGTPNQTMAALSLAAFRAGANACTMDPCRWSRPQLDHPRTLPPPSTWRFSPKRRPKKKMSLGQSASTGNLPQLVKQNAASTANSHKHILFRLQDRSFSLKLIKAWEDWKVLGEKGFVTGVSRFPKLPVEEEVEEAKPGEAGKLVKKDFGWLLLSNNPDTRLLRMGGACATLWKALALSTDEPGRIANNIHLIQPVLSQGGAGVATKRRYDIRVSPGLSAFEICQNKLKEGKKAAAVLLCNGEAVGGEFLDGHITGLEEDLLMRTDLFLYLREASHQAERRRILDSKGRAVHIPESGCLVCKDVRVFRNSHDTGYAPLKTGYFEIPAIFCVTLRNLNPHQSPSAQSRVEIANFDEAMYKNTLRSKFEMLLKGCLENKIETLALSDQGIARIHNKGAILGQAFGEALRKCRQRPPPLVLSGSSAFIAALKKTVVPQEED